MTSFCIFAEAKWWWWWAEARSLSRFQHDIWSGHTMTREFDEAWLAKVMGYSKILKN